MELDYRTIGKRIAARRKQLGLKQADVEEMAGIAYKYLSNIECAHSIPSTEVIMRLAAALDKGIFAGVDLGRWFPELSDCFMVAVTEKRTKEEIDALADALK